MNRSNQEIQNILSTFRTPDRARYPELDGYSRQVLRCKNWVKRAE